MKKRPSSIFPLNLEEKEQTNKKSKNNDGKICQALNGSFDSDSEAESSSDSSWSTETNVENDSFETIKIDCKNRKFPLTFNFQNPRNIKSISSVGIIYNSMDTHEKSIAGLKEFKFHAKGIPDDETTKQY